MTVCLSVARVSNFRKHGDKIPEMRAVAQLIQEFKSQYGRYPLDFPEVEKYAKTEGLVKQDYSISRDIIYVMPKQEVDNAIMLHCENSHGVFEYRTNDIATYSKKKR
ncbi:MAG: hypothetical protein LBD30_06655 [Verrucomicrobiales bacterium]|nr:hypothetical protein [Verrucomicrobiales bacterium]